MAVPLEKFVQQLEDSGILAGDTIKDFIPPKASPKDALELAYELVRKKKLTKFQAEEVSKGKGKSLVLGNYVLMEKIGAGGMGEVYKAEHRRMHRTVAIKMLPPNVTKDAAAIARFEREVTAAAKLRHPNIVAADDADCANGVHFLVMEMVEGSDLSALVKKNGPFSVEKAMNYIVQAAKGLEYAHKKGIVHRDIKPANLLLDKEGVVKILDMGLARLSLDGDDAPQADLTSTGTIMGTVDYMAPEQALDTKTADARADIYALGCSLYYLLTGKATYGGDTIMKKLLAHRDQPIPSLRAARSDVPEPLEIVFNKMVAKKLEDRYQTMSDVIAILEKQVAGQATADTNIELSSSINDESPTFMTVAPEVPTQTFRKPAASQAKQTFILSSSAVLSILILAGIIVSLRTKEGKLIVEVDQKDALVQVLDEDGKVEISQKGGGKVTILVDPGKHRLKVVKDGFTTFGQEFEMEKDGKREITAKLVPLEDKPAMVGTKPAPVAGEKKPLFFQTPGYELWAKEVTSLPAEKQIEAVSKKLMELNPGFDGKVMNWDGKSTLKIENGVVKELSIFVDKVTDISPIRALVGLKTLNCGGSDPGKGILADLSPIQGMSLTMLAFASTQVSDLSPLNGMPLTVLGFSSAQVSDLSPLTGMPLKELLIHSSKVSDLSPLRGMPLKFLNFGNTQVTDLTPLIGLPLTTVAFQGTLVSNLSPLQRIPLEVLHCNDTKVTDLSPLKDMKLLYFLRCDGTQITNFSPLKDMPLTHLALEFKPERDTELLRSIKTLETINGKPAAEFWKSEELKQVAFQQWSKDVAALPAEKQLEAIITKFQELNPDFKGRRIAEWKSLLEGDWAAEIESGMVVSLSIYTDNVTDISPLRALVGLKGFGCEGSAPGKGKLADLSPLAGMPLTTLWVPKSAVSDLSPLKGMPLTDFNIQSSQVSDLSPLQGMKLTKLFCSASSKISDLSPLKGMPLEHMQLEGLQATDLSPLNGMPCTSLNIEQIPASDLSPLKDMPLKDVRLNFKPERDTDIIRSIKTLETINGKPAAEFWKEVGGVPVKKPLAFQMPGFDQWVKDVQAMPAEQQVEAVSKKLVELNPGFDGTVSRKIESGEVAELMLKSEEVADLSPVRAISTLHSLRIFSSGKVRGKVSDLSPLEGMKLKTLACVTMQITDLSPLRGMPLTTLDCGYNGLSSLSPLEGMRLTDLRCGNTQVSDLSPLLGMPLEHLSCNHTRVSSLPPLKGMPLKELNCNGTTISDLSPLQGLKLTTLIFTPTKITNGINAVRTMTTLETIGVSHNDPKSQFSPAEFWVKYDAGEFGKPEQPAKPVNSPAFQQWAKSVAAMPAEEQLKAVVKKLQEVNPGYDGRTLDGNGTGPAKVVNGVVTEMGFIVDKVTDISPLQALTKVKVLNFRGTGRKTDFSDLSPLHGMSVTWINLSRTQVTDISVLKSLPLMRLTMPDSLVTDLSPLAGMRLQHINIDNGSVSDLSSLRGMPLTILSCNRCEKLSDLTPLEDCKSLLRLSVIGTKVSAASVTALQKALPNCQIDWDDPAKPKSPQHQ